MLQNQGRSPVGQGLAASHGSLRGASNIRRPLAPSRATPRPLPSGGAHPEQHDRAQHDAVTPAPQQLPQQQQQQPASDPEAKYQRFGPFFGGRFSLSDLVDAAPRVRVRTTASRARNELLELAVLNERLAGVVEPWEARARLEVLRNRRRAWDAVYDLVSGSDAAATLEVIEAAAEQVGRVCTRGGGECWQGGAMADAIGLRARHSVALGRSRRLAWLDHGCVRCGRSGVKARGQHPQLGSAAGGHGPHP
jgi:chlorophyllide a oxygenase